MLKASEQCKPRVQAKRQEFLQQAARLSVGRLHFVDETGSHIALTRVHARAPRGQRVVEHVPRNRGTVTTVIASMSIEGIEAVRTFRGSTNGERFAQFVAQDLLPKLAPGDVVVWDGLTAHRVLPVRALVEGAGATIVRLPPYSPELNPIEYAWPLVKRVLRTTKARTHEALATAAQSACTGVGAEQACAMIRHCGFGVATT